MKRKMPEVGTPRWCHRAKADSPARVTEIVVCVCVACTWKRDQSTGVGSFGPRPGTKRTLNSLLVFHCRSLGTVTQCPQKEESCFRSASCTPQDTGREGRGPSADQESKPFVVPWGLLREMSNILMITKASDTDQQQPARLVDGE